MLIDKVLCLEKYKVNITLDSIKSLTFYVLEGIRQDLIISDLVIYCMLLFSLPGWFEFWWGFFGGFFGVFLFVFFFFKVGTPNSFHAESDISSKEFLRLNMMITRKSSLWKEDGQDKRCCQLQAHLSV